MSGKVASIWRYPVKGFTPEALDAVEIAPGRGFPNDRIYAVENGPSGFDPQNPAFVSKHKFAVLAAIPQVAAARTAYDERTQTLNASAPGHPDIQARLADPAGREAFTAWLAKLIGADAIRGPLRVVEGPGHHFTDNPLGQVSIVNLESVRELGQRMGCEIDPLRFRANVYVEGWPAWAELGWAGRSLRVGGVETTVFKSIVRCLATHVDPQTAERDIEVTRALFDHYGHVFCGVYVRADRAGAVQVGDGCPEPLAQDVP
ncbi:MOSC domain-containing protein [Phenylobacterium immobile]|uniref:MOSC domain-containing protein n=1 Tax=Phenylobacterium immobile TaxID=21 RepID=UPI000B2236F0|nr:MOSC N-terminal beta barrel domain-containing protein [Phenylobacterium immobile]